MPEVLRDGAWNNNRNNARCANRNRDEPNERNNNIGFRCVRTEDRSECRSCVFYLKRGCALF
jgi:hypothetical protein